MPPKKIGQATSSTSKGQKGKGKMAVPTQVIDDSSSGDEYLADDIEEEEELDQEQKKRRTSPAQKFVNGKARTKYCDFIMRLIHIERQCIITASPYTDTLIEYGWQRLIVGPQNCNVTIAREFYANATAMKEEDRKEKGIYVRGQYWKLTSEVVNDHYELEDAPHDQLSELNRVGDAGAILKAVTIPGSDWERNSQGHIRHVALKNLTAEAKTWLMFINSRIMPMTPTSKITRDRVNLIYAIKHGLTVNVGKIVINQINKAITDETQAMPFPHLLYEYAVKQGIRIAPNEDSKAAMSPIRDTHLRNYQREERAERERREEEAQEADPDNEEIEEGPEQQAQDTQPAQDSTNMAPMQNALAEVQASMSEQHLSMVRHLDERWGNLQTSVETQLNSMAQDHNRHWSEIDNRLNQCQTGIHNLHLMMVYHHQTRSPNSYFPSIEELETQRMVVDTSRRVVTHGGNVPQGDFGMQPGSSAPNFDMHPGSSSSFNMQQRGGTSNFNHNPSMRNMNAPFPGFSRFSTPPPPPPGT